MLGKRGSRLLARASRWEVVVILSLGLAGTQQPRSLSLSRAR